MKPIPFSPRILALVAVVFVFVCTVFQGDAAFLHNFHNHAPARSRSLLGLPMMMTENDSFPAVQGATNSRRKLLESAYVVCTGAWALLVPAGPSLAAAAAAAERVPLDDLLYRILRVREATQQEMRLIKTGKFKDVQRANVKLAVKFMLDNYRLGDAFIAASTYLEGGTQRRIEAGQVGQNAVQSLYTILEYFDSSDVQNIKVGSNSMTGKEELVMKGLDAAKNSIDEFLAYFPQSAVDAVKAKVRQENELNVKEFDPSLGSIINMPTP